MESKPKVKFDIPDYDGIGIYAIINEQNGKMYVGSSNNVAFRLKQHLASFASGKCNRKFNEDIEKGYTFKAEILERISDGCTLGYLRGRERYYVLKNNCKSNGYNSTYSIAVFITQSPDTIVRKSSAGRNKNRDTKLLTLPKGRKAEIQAAADAAGETLNEYIVKAIDERIERLCGK